jgi:HAD superfamily hydrolase (TIGR01509 family)
MIRNILWDLDGTLFDTYPAITYAISKSLNEIGQSVALNVIDGLARHSIAHCLETLSQRFKLDPNMLGDRFAESYRRIDPANQPPYPGVRDVCALIHARGGLNVIVTHRGVYSTQRLLDTHHMTAYFDDIFSVEQGYPRKPDPAMLLAAMEKYTLNPGDTLVVGDRELDILAGQAAGVHTCLFGNSSLTVSADLRVTNHQQLLAMLLDDQMFPLGFKIDRKECL